MTGPSASSAAAATPLQDEDAIPEDPRLATLRRLVTILLIVLIVGVSAIVIALLLKLKEIQFEQSPATLAATAADPSRAPGLRPGERLISASATADRVTLLVEAPDGARRAVVLDARTLQPVLGVRDAAE